MEQPHTKLCNTIAQVLRTFSLGRKIGFLVKANEVNAFNVFLFAISDLTTQEQCSRDRKNNLEKVSIYLFGLVLKLEFTESILTITTELVQ